MNKLFEVFMTGQGSVFVEAPFARSALWRAATLFKMMGLNVAPSQLVAWEVS